MTNENNNKLEKKIIFNKVNGISNSGPKTILIIPIDIVKKLKLKENYKNYLADWKIIRISRGERYKHIVQMNIKRKIILDDTEERTIL